MKGFIKWMDNTPLLLKILFSLPLLNIIYAIYRIAVGINKGSFIQILLGILWIFLGATILWIVDLVCVIIYGKPVLFV